MNCCARSARPDQQLTRYQSVCSCRSPPSARPVTRLTATLNSQTGRPFGVIRSSGSRPTLPMMMILLTDATMSLVPSHHEVAEDIFREADGALELARLRWREREFDHAVLPVAVVRDLVRKAPLDEGYDARHPPAEDDGQVTLECANRHRHTVQLPTDAAARERIRNWIARRGAQLHVQHERWEAEEEDGTTEQKARIIRPSDRHRQTGQTAGMVREEALRTPALWAGVVFTEPGRFSGWHHHGTHESVIYVVSGAVRLDCGPGGKTTLHAGPGDCIYVPRVEIDRAANAGVEDSEIVVIRSGDGELVVNVAGPAD